MRNTLAIDLLIQFAKGVGFSFALFIVIGRLAYRRVKRRRKEAAQPSDPFGGSG